MAQQRGGMAGVGVSAIVVALIFILLPTLLPSLGIVGFSGRAEVTS